MGHLALGHQLGQQAELLLGGHRGIDAVQLEQVDPLEAEPSEAELALLAQVLGPPDREPLPRALAGEAGLGGDDQVLGVGVERLEDQPLAHLGPVGVGGVDEVDPHVDGTPEHPNAFVVVGGLAPDSGPGDLHGPEAQAVDGSSSRGARAEGEGSARAGRLGRASGRGGGWSGGRVAHRPNVPACTSPPDIP